MHRADDGEDGDSSPSGKLIAEMKVLAPRYRNCVSQFCAPAPCRVCAVPAPPAPAPRLPEAMNLHGCWGKGQQPYLQWSLVGTHLEVLWSSPLLQNNVCINRKLELKQRSYGEQTCNKQYEKIISGQFLLTPRPVERSNNAAHGRFSDRFRLTALDSV